MGGDIFKTMHEVSFQTELFFGGYVGVVQEGFGFVVNGVFVRWTFQMGESRKCE